MLDDARSLFNETGFEDTTVRAIADMAGVSVGSVFTTFASKSDILGQVMQDRLAAAAELADRLHGKPIQAIDIDDERPNVPVFIMPEDAHIAIK